MKYFFVFLAIAVVWLAVVLIAAIVPEGAGIGLFIAAQVLTISLFIIGFYKR